ncbi:Beta-hexosaminidase, family GH20 [Zostera marina]|uniref:Beta-hexosaminidase n=1 Tax=Zostera marina TaxID=29655 RepID=A0A0K9PHM4_ZOSMR|nr:Beta-hexosaminidase, family GH20 [Zostera marina]
MQVVWVLVFLTISTLVEGSTNDTIVYLWPLPKSVSYGSQSLSLSKSFKFSTDGGKYLDSSGILKDGFLRMFDDITLQHNMVGGNFKNGSYILEGVRVTISSTEEKLNYGTDESYKLSVPQSTGAPVYGHIEANTVFGALHGLQTFSQLCQFNPETRVIDIQNAPWVISDEPRFAYRGLLIDTSRHYQPLSMIKKTIDAMAYTKLNVLHWHIVDTQSFPLEIPSYPKLWNGAYSVSERYTMADALEIVQYAEKQGVNVLAEVDVPGHAMSWGVGYPELWPAHNCKQPLDVSKEFTFQVIDGILSDFSKVFKFKMVHLGGDEVHMGCWNKTHIKKWLKKKHMNTSDAYQYFILRAQDIAIKHGYEIINWEEPFNNFGSKLNPKTIVQNWMTGGVAKKAVKKGFRCILSKQESWYLDHLDITWEQFYLFEPLKGIKNTTHQKLIIGGEVCMWGETVDASDIEQTIWPRAAAAAERMWMPYVKHSGRLKFDVEKRLDHFRCLLNQRGVAAAPLFGSGRDAPLDPGSCYMQ